MAAPTPQSDAFYDHKRAEHGGQYVAACSRCQQLWEAMLAASRAKS